MIGIIDYGAGNLHSVEKALKKIGAKSKRISLPDEGLEMEKLILPGVGSFGSAAIKLQEKNFYPFLRNWHFENKPILGICLGMQLMMEKSDESNNIEGISLIRGHCNKLTGNKIPHIGWNKVFWNKEQKLFNGINNGSFFYFVHSYYVETNDDTSILGNTEYKTFFPSIIVKGSFTGMQFHPEKSGNDGLKILENWISGE